MHLPPTFRRHINAVEKVILQEDASGWQTFKYGKLGEVIENIRTFALPFENRTYTFKMQYEYDSWNRIQSMTYPDGEVVTYDYNLGGMLEKVYGGVTIDNIAAVDPDPLRNGGMTPTDDPVFTYTYPYIDSIAYNEFELKSEVFHGNGTHTLYFYDNIQRLQLLQSRTRAGEIMQDIIYSYDAVNNITDIANTAGELSNYLGGTNSRHYEYDSLYRLVYSYGQWDNIGKDVHLKDTLRMSYYKNGRISSKSSYANLYTEDVPGSTTQSRRRAYSYNTHQPNTLASVYDSVSQQAQLFYWDASGNMLTHRIPEEGNIVGHTWTEDNRLQTVTNHEWFSYYQYDATGDRTYKLPYLKTNSNRSGLRSVYWAPSDATLYVSPYLVVTPQGYTKHYYAESERVTSQIGRGRFPDLATPVTDTATANRKVRRADSLVLALNPAITDTAAQLAYLAALTERQNDTCEAYWYHPDHLGSSSWITDSAGTAVQHLHYLPWGEDFVNQRLNDFDGVRYTFSAKEKDAETGYSYFGSRYYSSDLSIWLSVDPMAAKYPSLSPYVYCANNPVKLVDPNGEENLPALLWARKNLSNKGIGFATHFNKEKGWDYQRGSIPREMVCYEACFIAYMNSSEKVSNYLKETDFATKSGGFRGRSTPNGGMNWFKHGDGTDRSFVTDISKGELGDIVFMGESGEMKGHAALLNGLPIPGSYENEEGKVVETMTLNVLSTSSDSDPNNFGEKSYVFEKQKDGSWKQQEGYNDYVFRGYGQINADFDN